MNSLEVIDLRLCIPYREYACDKCGRLIREPILPALVTSSVPDTTCPDCWAEKLDRIARMNEERWAREDAERKDNG